MGTKETIFEKMMNDMMRQEAGSQMLDECMRFAVNSSSKIPLRYRIIALGFVKKLNLDELNQKLEEVGCAKLYARNYWEASLIYAFNHGLSYSSWKKLEEGCQKAYTSIKSDYFNGNGITLLEMKDYLFDNSLDVEMATKHLTVRLNKEIEGLDADDLAFVNFMTENIALFTPVREKTRYYFLKYMYYYLKGKIDRFVEETGDRFGSEDQLSELTVLKGLTTLKKKKMEKEEKRAYLYDASISPKEIFDAFNYFYFEYVSLDWLEVLLEYYDDLYTLPENQKRDLARSIRNYNKALKKLSDDEVIAYQIDLMEKEEEKLDEIYSRDGDNKGYQRNRAGENAIRKMIKGNVDIDRTSLIAFLLFFDQETKLSEDMKIDRKRLQEILHECGYARLSDKSSFDQFILKYLEVEDKADFLMEEVTKYAINEQNFFLYQMYRDANSYVEEFEKYMK